jgi:hypothetical protein
MLTYVIYNTHTNIRSYGALKKTYNTHAHALTGTHPSIRAHLRSRCVCVCVCVRACMRACVCVGGWVVCVCVCVPHTPTQKEITGGEAERGRQREGGREREAERGRQGEGGKRKDAGDKTHHQINDK